MQRWRYAPCTDIWVAHMSISKRLLLSLLLAELLTSCATSSEQATVGATFILVRHAEKVPDNSRDPPLTAAGHTRSGALAASLGDDPLRAVYATAFRRTQQTAAPTAQIHALKVMTYDAKQSASQFAAQLKQAHPTGTVLVVGHSNTVPDIAAALCGCDVPRMEETEYGRRMTIRMAPDGEVRLTIAHDP